MEPSPAVTEEEHTGSALEVLLVALRLGLTSFGGPIAHIGYFHTEYVERRRWLSSERFAEVVALAQALPGPASSKVGIAIGILRAGYLGGFTAWVGFTLPSAALLIAFGFGVSAMGNVEQQAWLHGLKLAAVAIVAFAVWSMARTLAPDRERATIAAISAIAVLSLDIVAIHVVVILLAGGAGLLLARSAPRHTVANVPSPVGRKVAIGAWICFFGLLLALPALAAGLDSQGLRLVDAFYRTGALVFGGGHVMLPLLEREVVGPGWVTADEFLAGYGAAQAVPGPLFSFSAFLGTVMEPSPNGLLGGVLALCAGFLPSFLLMLGGLSLWHVLRSRPAFQSALWGINASVVGLLLAALYDPVWDSAVLQTSDFVIALAGFVLLGFWKASALYVVLFCAIAAEAVARL